MTVTPSFVFRERARECSTKRKRPEKLQHKKKQQEKTAAQKRKWQEKMQHKNSKRT